MTSAAGVANRPSTTEEQGVEYRRFVKNRCRWALLLTLAAAVILILSGSKPAARGVALGGLFSVLNFLIMSRTLAGRMARSGWSGRSFGFIWILARLGLTALPPDSGLQNRLSECRGHGRRALRRSGRPCCCSR